MKLAGQAGSSSREITSTCFFICGPIVSQYSGVPIQKYLPIRWVYSTGGSFSDEGKIAPLLASESASPSKIESKSEITLLPYRMLDRSDRETMIQLAKIGYMNELLSFLKGLEGDRKLNKQHADRLTSLVKNYRFDELITCLEEML